jgi:hypothetical protein
LRRAARGLATAAALALPLAPASACKPRETLAPIDMTAITPDGAVSEDAKRMTWASVTPRVVAHANGALVVWLEEPGTSLGHVRFILPTRTHALGGASAMDAAATWVVTDALEAEWRRRLLAWDADPPMDAGEGSGPRPRGDVSAVHRPGRVELVVHVADADVPRVLSAWGELVAQRRPLPALSRAQGRVVAALPPPSHELVAVAHAVAILLGDPPTSLLATRAGVERLSTSALEKAWGQLLDPRGAAVIVHASSGPELLQDAASAWDTQWKGRGLAIGRRHEERDVLLARIQPPLDAPARRERLMAIPPLTLQAVDSPATGRQAAPQAVLARVVPTPTARDRALLRLGQRILQEEMDLRVVFMGTHAIVVARIPLSATQPGRSLVEGAARWRNVLEGTMTRERLETAARLWIGARWVNASLQDEDATALWSEAMELATRDDGIASALDEDTAAMLAMDVDTWTTFARRWLDPSKGEPGWVGVVVGATEAQRSSLSEVTPVER